MKKCFKDYTISELRDICISFKGNDECDLCPLKKLFLNSSFVCKFLRYGELESNVEISFDVSFLPDIVSIDVIENNRVYYALRRADFVSLNQLCHLSRRDIIKIRGIGEKGFNIIYSYLCKYFNIEDKNGFLN